MTRSGDEQHDLRELLDSLSQREREILMSRFGIDLGGERPMSEIARDLKNIARAQIRAIEKKGS